MKNAKKKKTHEESIDFQDKSAKIEEESAHAACTAIDLEQIGRPVKTFTTIFKNIITVLDDKMFYQGFC